MMEPHLLIEIDKENTKVSYIDAGVRLQSHEYGYGYIHGKERFSYISGVLYMMEMINVVETIPNKIIINFIEKNDEFDHIDYSDMRHMKEWYADILNKYNYTQFVFRNNKQYRPVYVIINNDERHQKHNPLRLKY